MDLLNQQLGTLGPHWYREELNHQPTQRCHKHRDRARNLQHSVNQCCNEPI